MNTAHGDLVQIENLPNTVKLHKDGELHARQKRRLRLSNYTIFVNLSDHETLLVHGYSGAWDIIDSHLANDIRRFRHGPVFKPLIGDGFHDELPDKSINKRRPRLHVQVRDLMVKRGYLTSLTVEEEQQQVAKLAAKLHAMASEAPPSYVLTLSYECNLRCSYCFQDALRSNPDNAPRLVAMTTDMVDRIFAAMQKIDSRHQSAVQPPTRRITLFGGEPLLRQFHPLVEYIVKRARADGPVAISAITNGTELHHFTDLVGPDKISFLQITLDGPPSEHDLRRVGPERVPTFDVITRNIDLALALDAKVKVRVNVDSTNVDSLPTLARLMNDRGWFKFENFSAYATPVHESTTGGHESCGFGSWNLSSRLVELGEIDPIVRLIEGPDAPWQRRIRDVLEGTRDPIFSLQPSFCGAHTQTWVFDAHGDIYACWEQAGYAKERIGWLSKEANPIMIDSIEKTWRGRTIASNPVCGRCPYAFYCGGGCALLAERQNGKLYSNFCDDFSRRFKTLAASEVRSAQLNTLRRAASAMIVGSRCSN